VYQHRVASTSPKTLLTLDNVFEVLDETCSFVDFIQPWHLDEPSDIVRDELVVDYPFGEFIPFIKVSGK
jgi:hypothetical protein